MVANTGHHPPHVCCSCKANRLLSHKNKLRQLLAAANVLLFPVQFAVLPGPAQRMAHGAFIQV